MSDTGLAARVAGAVGTIDAAAWNALAGDNPFTRHEFLTALEESGSVGPGTGWQPVPLVISSEDGGDLLELNALVAAGSLTPAVDRTFPLERAADAVDHLTDGAVRGKIALTI